MHKNFIHTNHTTVNSSPTQDSRKKYIIVGPYEDTNLQEKP